VRIGRKRRQRFRDIGEWARIDVDRGVRHVLRREFPPNLNDMAPGTRPGFRQRPGKHAGASRAPDFLRVKPGCERGVREARDRRRQIDAEGLNPRTSMQLRTRFAPLPLAMDRAAAARIQNASGRT
jgi:hypothetical protein